MPNPEGPAKLYFVVRQYPQPTTPGRLTAFIGRDHPRRIMALDHVVAFFEIDEFSAYESIRELTTEQLANEVRRRLELPTAPPGDAE